MSKTTSRALWNEVTVEARDAKLPGSLHIPADAVGIVVFAHGSGSGRLSPRNQLVAQWLNERGCGTLLFDLLTSHEAEDRRNVFDIRLLGERVRSAVNWLRDLDASTRLPIGVFGASTGAAAALVAAAEEQHAIAAVVSRGGRPDLAGEALPRVAAPTLLIVGSLDAQVLELNRHAQRQMRCTSRIAVVAGATHLFEEPGTLEEVGRLAGDWFIEHFTGSGSE